MNFVWIREHLPWTRAVDVKEEVFLHGCESNLCERKHTSRQRESFLCERKTIFCVRACERACAFSRKRKAFYVNVKVLVNFTWTKRKTSSREWRSIFYECERISRECNNIFDERESAQCERILRECRSLLTSLLFLCESQMCQCEFMWMWERGQKTQGYLRSMWDRYVKVRAFNLNRNAFHIKVKARRESKSIFWGMWPSRWGFYVNRKSI